MYCYTKALRLTKADEFSSVFIFRKIKSGGYLKIHFKPNELENSRLGLIVSKKISKRANKRKYMKRVLREIFRQSQDAWLGHDVIVRVHKYFTPEEYALIKLEFEKLTQKLLKA